MVEAQIRAYGKALKTSWEYNSAMWPATKDGIKKFKSDFDDWSGDENLTSFETIIENMVTVYKERLDGMNTLITNGKFTK